MIYIIDKQTNEVKMVSETEIEFDQNIFYSQKIEDNDIAGYKMFYRNGNLEKTKILSDTEIKELNQEKINDAKTISDLKDILKQLI